MKRISLIVFLFAALSGRSQYVKENYDKTEADIKMRDGIHLHTVIYTPKETGSYPILMERTPYSAGPYGKDIHGSLGPNKNLMKEKYIFVIQDVRGRYMSEGMNLEVTPHIAVKKGKKDVDESSDTYDTVDWLLKNVKNNNGRVGLHGISYPGFYATACLPGAHPAIKAVSPQAPVTDEFMGDDANHNGAFFLMDNFSFMNYFGKERKGPVADYGSQVFPVKFKDAYQFFLEMGSVGNTNGEKYYNGKSYIWNEYLQHDTYDAYWKARNIRQHLKNISIPTLVVGGWFDAEDLFGALRTYSAIEKQSPANKNFLVMGPWTHGAWASGNWTRYGPLSFGSNTSAFYQDSIETVFFNYYLKDKGRFPAHEATVFETGNNQWRTFNTWPPAASKPVAYYLQPGKAFSTDQPPGGESFDEYTSDPANPVPYTNGVFAFRNNKYMVEDQYFALLRPDVLAYTTVVLSNDITLAGEIKADLKVSITGTDADFIVKLIDVSPGTGDSAGLHQLVRAEVMRGKFRKSFEKPVPFVPGKVETVSFALNDVMHTFKKGHRIMIQVQSSWFPLADRNPQKFMRIPDAQSTDFQKANIRVYHDAGNASRVLLPVLQ